MNALEGTWTPLHFAMHRSSNRVLLEILAVLIGAGADVNKPDLNGNTPLHKAAEVLGSTSSGAVQYLISHGANVDQPNREGKTPLHIAALHGCGSSIFNVLIKAKAKINVSDNDGKTPLHAAAQSYGGKQLIEKLILAGANMTLQDNQGKTALDLAQEEGHKEIVEVITNSLRARAKKELEILGTAGIDRLGEKSPAREFSKDQYLLQFMSHFLVPEKQHETGKPGNSVAFLAKNS